MLMNNLSSKRLIIPSTFEDCLTYGQRQEFMWKKILELEARIVKLEEEIKQQNN